MNMTNENKKEKTDRLWSGLSSFLSMVLIIVLLLAFGLKSQIPPPPPKKTFYVELDADVGGGGGGGMDAPTPNKVKSTAAPNYATQNAQQAPSVAHSEKTSATPEPATPKVDQGAIFKGGKGGSGSGGGKGSGIGTGTGSGLGPGEGSGSGGGIGYGNGTRGLVHPINTSVSEQGQVCVEVHVMADGTVSEARVINSGNHKTTITNRQIQQQCVQEAKRAKYKPGKEELRIIVFH